MRKQIFLWVLSLLMPLGVFAQVTASGTVISGEDNFPIIGAAVQCKEVPTVGTATDMDGNFTLEVPAGVSKLVIKYMGFKEQEVTPGVGLNIVLHPDVEVIEDGKTSLAFPALPVANIISVIFLSPDTVLS